MVVASRYVARNSGYRQEAVNTMEEYAVGDGITAQSTAPDAKAAAQYMEYWKAFSARPEITGRFDMPAVQRLLSRSLDIDGEIFIVKTFDLFDRPKIQLLETHQISSESDPEKRIWDGVKFDSVGRPKAYNKIVRTPDGKERTISIPAQSVLHVFSAESATAARGIPPGQHGLNYLRDHMELLAYETGAVKQASELGLVLKSNRETGLQDGDFALDSEGAAPATSEEDIAKKLGMRAIRIDVEESIDSFQSNRPNSMFDGFLEMLERESTSRVPYELVRDASKVGGAAVRMVGSKADRAFSHRQKVITSTALSPLWTYVIGWGIDSGELPISTGWSRVQWQFPRRFTVDAGREEQQARANVEGGLETMGNYLAERGIDFEQHLMRRRDEARKIMDAAGISADTPIPLWMLYRPAGQQFDIGEKKGETE
jgi:capsid protein